MGRYLKVIVRIDHVDSLRLIRSARRAVVRGILKSGSRAETLLSSPTVTDYSAMACECNLYIMTTELPIHQNAVKTLSHITHASEARIHVRELLPNCCVSVSDWMCVVVTSVLKFYRTAEKKRCFAASGTLSRSSDPLLALWLWNVPYKAFHT